MYPAVVCENVLFDTSEKNLIMSGMEEFVIARARLIIPPVEHGEWFRVLKSRVLI